MCHCTENVTAVLSCCSCLRFFKWCAAACQGRSLPYFSFVFGFIRDGRLGALSEEFSGVGPR